MKTITLLTLLMIGLVLMLSTEVLPNVNAAPNYSQVHQLPKLTSSENQTIIDTALSVPVIRTWSHDWQYVTIGFGGNNKPDPNFQWQYALVTLRAPSSSAPVSCDIDWWAYVEVDLTTMKVVSTNYPTMESHICHGDELGGPSANGLGFNSTDLYYIPLTIDSPLKQVQSGIMANNITCNKGLQLVIKAEDGSPACVKPESVSKLLIRGWAMLSLKNFGANLAGHGPDSLTNISENNCGPFHTVSVKPHNGTIVPALLMYSNSTGCARLTYTINYDYNNTSNDSLAWPRIANFSFLHIDTLKYTSNGDSFGVTSGKDFTNSFKITTVPETVDLANFPIGSNFTITYIIRPLPNATGFYDESLPEPVCLEYPLAVNYNADQVNSSDFSKGLFSMQNHSCISEPDELSGIKISGMSYKEMILP